MSEDSESDAIHAKTYVVESFARWVGQIRVYVSLKDNCLRIRQDNQEIILARHAAQTLGDAMMCALHAHEHGIRDGEPGYGEPGYKEPS